MARLDDTKPNKPKYSADEIAAGANDAFGGGSTVGERGARNTGARLALDGFKKSYTAPPYTWDGHRAQVLHLLKERFGLDASSYPNHDGDGQLRGAKSLEVASADLWGKGVNRGDVDNTKNKQMNAAAEYIRQNKKGLGVQFVIWANKVDPYDGSVGAWKQYEKFVSNNHSHMNHLHITFGAGPQGGLQETSEQVQAALDWTANIPELFGAAIARGFLRFGLMLYGYSILRPLDFAGGFAFEFYQTIKDQSDPAEKGGAAPTDSIFSGQNWNRFYFMFFTLVTYWLAFGRNDSGNYGLQDTLENGGNLFNRDTGDKGKRGAVRRAKLPVAVKGVTTARRTANKTSQRKVGKGTAERKGISGDAKRDGADGRSAKRKVPSKGKDGKFVSERGRGTEETKENAERRGEITRREEN